MEDKIGVNAIPRIFPFKFLEEQEVLEKEWNSNKYWYPEEVAHDVLEYLKSRFPGRIIIKELFKVDYFVLGEDVPVEVQRTIVENRDKGGILTTRWIQDAWPQVELNIKIYGQCWLFFDKAFLNYLQKVMARNSSADFDWLHKYFIEGKMRLFTISKHTGDSKVEIEEVRKEDFTFLLTDDDWLLEGNKPSITKGVLKKNAFSEKEISDMRYRYESEKIEGIPLGFRVWLGRPERTYREKALRDILLALDNLLIINDALSFNISNRDRKYDALGYGITLGLFEKKSKKGKKRRVVVSLSDKYMIARDFPGYLKYKTFWDHLRSNPIYRRSFFGMICGEARPEAVSTDDDKSDLDAIILPVRTAVCPDRKVNVPILKKIGKTVFRDLCKIHPLYNKGVRIKKCGGKGAEDLIPIDTLGKWLFGISGYKGNMSLDINNGEICLPTEAPDETEKMIIDVTERYLKSKSDNK